MDIKLFDASDVAAATTSDSGELGGYNYYPEKKIFLDRECSFLPKKLADDTNSKEYQKFAIYHLLNCIRCSDYNDEFHKKEELEDLIIKGKIPLSIETGDSLDAIWDVIEWIKENKLCQSSLFIDIVHNLEDISEKIQLVRDSIFELKDYRNKNIEIKSVQDIDQQRKLWRESIKNETRYLNKQISSGKDDIEKNLDKNTKDELIRILREKKIIIKWLKKQISKSDNDEFIIRLQEMVDITGMKIKIGEEVIKPEMLYRGFRYALFLIGDFEVNLMSVDNEPLLMIRKALDSYRVADSLLYSYEK